MLENVSKTIAEASSRIVDDERKEFLFPLINYIQAKLDLKQHIQLHFICTHNSRRSHLSQIWAQTMAYHFGIKNITCFSGGTEVTAMFPKVVETLILQGFEVQQSVGNENLVYEIKFSEDEPSLFCYSKLFDDVSNPKAEFAAIMNCSSAEKGCPFIPGASLRIAIRYDDPKFYDGTELMDLMYKERSMEIASEMYFIFNQINK